MRSRTIASILLIVMVMMLFAGCGNDHKGKYYSEDNKEFYMELKGDNVFTINVSGVEIEGTYEIIDEDISLLLMGMPSGGKIIGKTIIDPAGARWTKK